ncbi:hypothetical protein Tsubulata_045268 [Turnera subulata]|uniref:Dehydrogenase/reductase SDR family member 7 n=1 Tax=Turnera subulata TaxID=218843 RepID=A0A9Q0JAF3_9ROSI|nr:hypothetical protein Tsubulata_045268 [Turnera subulata]
MVSYISTLLLLSVFLLLPLAFLIKLLISDGDLTLMSKKHVKPEQVEDKVIWITGASRGIGEILAKQLAILGAKLILSARNEAELERVRKQLTGKYATEAMILPLDLASGEFGLKEAVEKAESCFNGAGVDYMIHNAAYERPVSEQLDLIIDIPRSMLHHLLLYLLLSVETKEIIFESCMTNNAILWPHLFFPLQKTTLLDVTEESLKATFNINVLGTISLTRLLAAYMLKRGRGHFVVMSSAAGKTPAPGQAVYSASKFALNGYFHSLRSELYQRGIKVTVVCPGPIETSNGTGTTSGSEKRVSSTRCAELTIIAMTHDLKEAWISNQPVLAIMYLVQYMPTIGYWVMDKAGGNRVAAAAEKGNTYSLSLLFGKRKAS